MNQNAIFIIWNSLEVYFDDIVFDISKVVKINKESKIFLSNYYDFICDIYKYNNQSELGRYKASKMCVEEENYVCILNVSFQTENMNDYAIITNLKKEIRKKYQNLIDNYFHDNIIHATDSIEEYSYLMDILEKYLN